jgi:glycosyltransferase involved in cell wall biosynthesis
MIPHGIPNTILDEAASYKQQFGLANKKILLTFGLISPGKGIEIVIDALPEIVSRHPEVIYLVVGATHPHIRTQQGEDYRIKLYLRANKLGIAKHIVFHNQFVTDNELLNYIGAADICITPYPNREQIVSGPLSYALGMGRVVVSTPYRYACELLSGDRGQLVPFRNHRGMAQHIVDLLDNPERMEAMRNRAFEYGRQMTWKQVGKSYINHLSRTLAAHKQKLMPMQLGLTQIRPIPEVADNRNKVRDSA